MTTVTTRTVVFAGVDQDCDGANTAFYRFELSTDVQLADGDYMPEDVYRMVFHGRRYYFAHDELWFVPADDFAKISERTAFSRMDGYEYATLSGNALRNL